MEQRRNDRILKRENQNTSRKTCQYSHWFTKNAIFTGLGSKTDLLVARSETGIKKIWVKNRILKEM
jgi:hypothetical protein